MNPDFGSKHLIGLAWLLSLIAIVLTVLLIIKKKKNLGVSFDRAVIRYTCYFMWAWEIIKTVRMINYEDYGPVGYYPLWMAPFHICSMGLYAYPIVGSKRAGKLAEWVTPFAYAVLMIVTSIILIIPGSAALLGTPEDWSFCFHNLLPYQTWLYHGSLLFVSLYMVLSGFYKPRFIDIPKGAAVLCVVAAGAQALNYILEGSGADYMTLRYGNGNPFVFLLNGDAPILYYLVLSAVSIGGMALVITVTIGIRAVIDKIRAKKAVKAQ
jgi:hypothetical protein